MKFKTVSMSFLSLLVLGATTTSIAAETGLYAGAIAGVGHLNTPGNNLFTPNVLGATNTHDVGGLAARAFGGYQLTPNLGVEVGYTYFSESKYYAKQSGNAASLKYKPDVIDAVGKASVFLDRAHNVTLFVKAGVARISQEISYQNDDPNNIVLNIAPGAPAVGTQTVRAWKPTVGAGASLNFNPQVSADLSWMRVISSGNIRHTATDFHSTDILGLGLTYHFE